MTATYKNPWHNPAKNWMGTPMFTTSAKPTEYRGYLIYKVNDSLYDVVQNGVCVKQLAGPNGARRAIDALLDEPAEAVA